MVKPIYGLVMGLPSQLAIIEAHCFKSCAQIMVGAINTDFCGMLLVCRTEAKDCPRFNREMDKPIGEVLGDPIYIRKLK